MDGMGGGGGVGGKPSTGCGATQRRKNTNAWITGREAHQNAGTNANATLIYSLKQVDPSTHTHIPSGEEKRAHEPCQRDGHGGTGAQRATVLEQEPSVAPATDQVTIFHWKRYLAHRILGQPGLVSPSTSQGTSPQDCPILRWKFLGNIFNDRDLISVPGPAPSGEASESFPAPPGGPDEKGRRPFRLCEASPGGRIRKCSFVHPAGGGVTGEVGGHSGHPPEGVPHVTPLRGTLRGSSRPAPSGPGRRVVSTESRRIPRQIERKQPRAMRENRSSQQVISPQDMTVTPVLCSQGCNGEFSPHFGPTAGPLRRDRAAACNSTRGGGRLGDSCDGVGSMARVGTPCGYRRDH